MVREVLWDKHRRIRAADGSRLSGESCGALLVTTAEIHLHEQLGSVAMLLVVSAQLEVARS
jgi:hypothetical protein